MDGRIKRPCKPCLLFMPVLEDRFWNKLASLSSRLGGVVLDMEDSIYEKAKDEAREQIIDKVEILEEIKSQHPDFSIIIRINNQKTKHFLKDVALINELESKQKTLDGVMYPKPAKKEEIENLSRSFKNESTYIFAVIETMKGYENFSGILSLENRVKWCAVGAEDLCADMDIERPIMFYNNPLLERITTDIVLHAKMKGLCFWGNIWPYLNQSDLLCSFMDECAMDLAIGAAGKVSFHPYQIDIINMVFNPGLRKEIHKKNFIARLTEISKRIGEGLTVGVSNCRMVDMPELVRFKKWLDQEFEVENGKKAIGDFPPHIVSLLEDYDKQDKKE